MTTMNLKTGLAKMIEEVEKLPQDTVFGMGSYNTCVIGKTVKWSLTHGNKLSGSLGLSESIKTLRRLFGIKCPKCVSSFNKPFANEAGNMYTARTWAVIRLFTTDIGNKVTRDEWLELATEQYCKM